MILVSFYLTSFKPSQFWKTIDLDLISLFNSLNQFRYLEVDALQTKSNIVGCSIDIEVLALSTGDLKSGVVLHHWPKKLIIFREYETINLMSSCG